MLRNEIGNAGATPVRTSIMFPGQDDVTADGVPAQPELVTPGTPADGLVSLVPSVLPGNTITYAFTATHAGTYIYESGTNTAEQLQMGLFGGLIVRPATGANGEHLLYAGHPATRYDPRREVVHLLSDVDPALHLAVDAGKPAPPGGFQPRYWFINGRGFPDTTAPNNADWLPSQPYGSSLHVLPLWNPAHHNNAAAPAGYDVLPAAVRYINASETAHPFHPHSADTLVHAIDGRPLESATGVDLTENHYAIEIAPGQTHGRHLELGERRHARRERRHPAVRPGHQPGAGARAGLPRHPVHAGHVGVRHAVPRRPGRPAGRPRPA